MVSEQLFKIASGKRNIYLKRGVLKSDPPPTQFKTASFSFEKTQLEWSWIGPPSFVRSLIGPFVLGVLRGEIAL